MENEIGNISTIIKWISMYLAGWLIGTLAAHGLNLPVDATVLSQVIFGFIMLFIGYIDAKYTNTYKWLGNAKEAIDPTEPVLNDEYECDDNGA